MDDASRNEVALVALHALLTAGGRMVSGSGQIKETVGYAFTAADAFVAQREALKAQDVKS